MSLPIPNSLKVCSSCRMVWWCWIMNASDSTLVISLDVLLHVDISVLQTLREMVAEIWPRRVGDIFGRYCRIDGYSVFERIAISESMPIARSVLRAPITAAGVKGYRRSYESVLNLHLTYELELIHQVTRTLPIGSQQIGSKTTTTGYLIHFLPV